MAVVIAGVILLLTQTNITITPRNIQPFSPLDVDFGKYLEVAEKEGADSARALYRSDTVRSVEQTTRRIEDEWQNSLAGKMEKIFDILSGKNERRELEYDKWKTWMDRYAKEELVVVAPPPPKQQTVPVVKPPVPVAPKPAPAKATPAVAKPAEKPAAPAVTKPAEKPATPKEPVADNQAVTTPAEGTQAVTTPGGTPVTGTLVTGPQAVTKPGQPADLVPAWEQPLQYGQWRSIPAVDASGNEIGNARLSYAANAAYVDLFAGGNGQAIAIIHIDGPYSAEVLAYGGGNAGTLFNGLYSYKFGGESIDGVPIEGRPAEEASSLIYLLKQGGLLKVSANTGEVIFNFDVDAADFSRLLDATFGVQPPSQAPIGGFPPYVPPPSGGASSTDSDASGSGASAEPLPAPKGLTATPASP
jgi:hypothetical protein